MNMQGLTARSTFNNLNECKSWNQTIGTGLTKLSGTRCGEVIIWNRSGANLTVYDKGRSASAEGFLLEDNDQFTFRGLTSSDQVSATAATAGVIYVRSQYFSSNPVR